ncbi:MAG TPA: hypothetical protein ACFCUC_00110 [Desulfobacterales bacterium]
MDLTDKIIEKITPAFGPRIRFRSLLLNREAAITGPLEFNPCEGCHQPCRKDCPTKAFQSTVYTRDALGQSILPGINGTHDRVACNVRMEKDIEEAVMKIPATDKEHRDIKLTNLKKVLRDNRKATRILIVVSSIAGNAS